MLRKTKRRLTEAEIDQRVILEVEDEQAWGKPVHVKAILSVPPTISPKLIKEQKRYESVRFPKSG